MNFGSAEWFSGFIPPSLFLYPKAIKSLKKERL